ncbi:hypothetical protein [Streptomyces sp. NPDC093094]|uniref:hypothetical protein n=1 Tax=Streptomyces sp. NPDC093094 TaxID=3366026 RepID=UPI0037FEA196
MHKGAVTVPRLEDSDGTCLYLVVDGRLRLVAHAPGITAPDGRERLDRPLPFP